MMVDWIEGAWKVLKYNSESVKKSFLVTGLSTVPGTEGEALIHKDHVVESIWQLLQPQAESSDDKDPLPTSDDSDNDSDDNSGDDSDDDLNSTDSDDDLDNSTDCSSSSDVDLS